MKRTNQKGFTIVEALIILSIFVLAGGVGWYVYQKNHKATATPPANHTAEEAVAFTQTTYDNYLIALNKANSDTSNTQPVAQVGLATVKDDLSADLYAKAAAVTRATPFSCTAQYVTDKYTASLASSNKTNAVVAIVISNGNGLTTSGMSASVDLASLKITAVTCPT